METLRGAARKWAAFQKHERGMRMTMFKQKVKKSFWQKVQHFFLKFNMCKCTEPKYEVLEGILSCNNCRKPATWVNQPK